MHCVSTEKRLFVKFYQKKTERQQSNDINFINGLECASLVIDTNDGDEDGIESDGIEESGELNASGCGFDGEVADVEALSRHNLLKRRLAH